MKSSIWLVFFYLITPPLIAQSDEQLKINHYEKNAIYRFGNGYIKNGAEYKLKELRNEFSVSEEGAKYWNAYRSLRSKGLFVGYTSTAFSITSIVIVEKNREIGLGFLGGATALVFISGHLLSKAGKLLNKAIWTRNRDALIHL